VEYHQRSSTAPRLREDLDDLAAVMPLTTSTRPHVLAPSRRSEKLVRQTASTRSTGQWSCGRCDRVCDSRVILCAHRKFHRCVCALGSGQNDNERCAREPSINCQLRRQSSAGVIPRAKIKTIKMTFVIVLGISARLMKNILECSLEPNVIALSHSRH